MKKALTLLAVISVSTICYSQNFWEEIPFPFNLDIRCMAINDQGDIFVGTQAGVYRLKNEEHMWKLVYDSQNNSARPTSIAINKNQNIYVLCSFSMAPLIKSIDNGETWDTLSMPDYGNNFKIITQGNDTLYVSQWASNGALLLKSINAGVDWEVVFYTDEHTSEVIEDIAISPNGEVALGLLGFYPDMGGLYISPDGGSGNWEFYGLINNMVQSVKYNKLGDLFIGVISSDRYGIYARYHDNPYYVIPISNINVNSMILNSNGDIFASTVTSALIKSTDNGLTFEYADRGLHILDLAVDNNDYLYGLNNKIYKSKTPTFVSINDNIIKNKNALKLYTSPINRIINGFIDVVPLPADNYYGYKITDVGGRIVSTGKIAVNQGKFQLDINYLTSGFYVYSMSINSETYSAKIIKR